MGFASNACLGVWGIDVAAPLRSYPIPNMISALSFAAVNTPVDGAPDSGAVLLVPPGTLTTSKYTRPSEMNFFLSGISVKLPGAASVARHAVSLTHN